MWEDGRLHLCDDIEVRTRWQGDDRYHEGIEAVLRAHDDDGSPLSGASAAT